MKTRARHPAALRPARGLKAAALVVACGVLTACASYREPVEVGTAAQLTPATPSTHDLLKLPEPKGKIVVAVYGFRDQTGQYKPSPDSSFSTSVTQGAASMLVKALKDSGWFTPVERESLQELLTERRIVRALDGSQDKNAPQISIPALLPASILIDGGIISYESNVRTGGLGARFLGIGLSTQYRMDQVTVGLRSVDIRSGRVLQTVSTTKTIFSYEVRPSVFKFVNFKDLLEIEGGITQNEPAQLCVKEAIEAAVVHLTVQGLKDSNWALKNPDDWNSSIIQDYLRAEAGYAQPLDEAQASTVAAASTAAQSE
ncbi:CsgG/HfaB family protein [Pusillimonas noertemannii]|uniref:Curli biogenesis system outer membrane secretion channel CsgG n=2 Tax=Pusillimonas noertemannii TaxID=305977 RepID=A0A2U1CHQ1_9BURK|nr:CsgG/HfaB family protein [Pusillimonas noertemannii]NYT70307.1 curli production assembly/transport protein CsgG [Pusillimonas noertemannii]PVY60449.1 curli biogenesis system outer membrane secretion channel CsgG [Pusillimonas noertemannii]TFL08055.1 curli production assembly/transport protein CsgG [Pusillimonas noertemannii]